MSLHIQMSEEAEAELRKSAMRNRISSLSASILLIVLGGLILFLTAVYIAKEVPAEFVAPHLQGRLPLLQRRAERNRGRGCGQPHRHGPRRARHGLA